MRSTLLCSTTYATFDYSKAGNYLKDTKCRGELTESVPITARAKKFPLKKSKSTVTAERKKIPVILGYAFTGTLDYMQGDLNRSTSKKTATGKDYQQPIFHIYFTPFYTSFCC